MEKNNPDNLNSFFSLIKEEKKKKDEEKKELIGEISFETMFQDMAVETARLKKEINEKETEKLVSGVKGTASWINDSTIIYSKISLPDKNGSNFFVKFLYHIR